MPEVTLSDKFVAASNLLHSCIDERYHSSLNCPQYNLGNVTPVQYVANGGKLETILNMFKPVGA